MYIVRIFLAPLVNTANVIPHSVLILCLCLSCDDRKLSVAVLDHQVIMDSTASVNYPWCSPFYLRSAPSLRLNNLHINPQPNFGWILKHARSRAVAFPFSGTRVDSGYY